MILIKNMINLSKITTKCKSKIKKLNPKIRRYSKKLPIIKNICKKLRNYKILKVKILIKVIVLIITEELKHLWWNLLELVLLILQQEDHLQVQIVVLGRFIPFIKIYFLLISSKKLKKLKLILKIVNKNKMLLKEK